MLNKCIVLLESNKYIPLTILDTECKIENLTMNKEMGYNKQKVDH